MSCSPHGFGFLSPTRPGLLTSLLTSSFSHQAHSVIIDGSSPKNHVVVGPARQAYSHSASLGRRYFFPVFSDSLRQNSFASCQLTESTGAAGSLDDLLGFRPITASYWPCVTSWAPS